jgi:ribonuclease HI
VKLTVHVDGGARGNPGPAAIAAVVSDENGEIVTDASQVIGRATNNVAEYRALLLGIATALELGATELDLVGDSELVVKQVRGEYKVKNADLKPLHAEVGAALAGVPNWSIRHVRREHNAEADRLVNEALDAA